MYDVTERNTCNSCEKQRKNGIKKIEDKNTVHQSEFLKC